MIESLQIPYAKDSAAGNMAKDYLLLEWARRRGAPCHRFYGWSEPAFTFGYSQQWDWVQAAVGPIPGSLVRRPTGGGLVDHRKDLTYALVIPHGHPYHRRPASELYQELHSLIAEMLHTCGLPCLLQPCDRQCSDPPEYRPGICFQAPEPFDIIDARSQTKLAGAAMKRNRDGVLIQGSLDLPEASTEVHPFIMKEFHARIPDWLGTHPLTVDPDWPPDALKEKQELFESGKWNRKR